MDTLRLILALLGIVAVVVLLVMKKETKTVLIGVGLILLINLMYNVKKWEWVKRALKVWLYGNLERKIKR